MQCRGCEAACPSGVPFGHLMEGARTALASRAAPSLVPSCGGSWSGSGTRSCCRATGLLLALTWLAWVGQRMRLVPKRLGLPRSSRTFAPRAAARRRASRRVALHRLRDGRVATRRPPRRASTVMRAAGAHPGLPGRGGDCCGALHVHAGRVDEARRLARRVITSMPGDAPVVVDSAGCGAAMKEYGRLLGTDDARAFSARVRDFGEWVAAQPAIPLRDTGRGRSWCRIRAISGTCSAPMFPFARCSRRAYRIHETADEGLCCGAGGVYAVLQPALANEIRDAQGRRDPRGRRAGARGGVGQSRVLDAPRGGRPRHAAPRRAARRGARDHRGAHR